MLKIRMQRTGRRNDPSFRIIVAEHTRSPKTGNFLERVGSYNPKTKERQLDAERITYWMGKGAKVSDTMHNMLISAGIIKGEKINVLPKKTPILKEAPAAEASAPAEAQEESTPETPAAEAPEAPAPADDTPAA